MVVFFRRIFKMKKRLCCIYFKFNVSGMIECLLCGEMKLFYCVCKVCGLYNGKDINVKSN